MTVTDAPTEAVAKKLYQDAMGTVLTWDQAHELLKERYRSQAQGVIATYVTAKALEEIREREARGKPPLGPEGMEQKL